jgi:hypothetical protein
MKKSDGQGESVDELTQSPARMINLREGLRMCRKCKIFNYFTSYKWSEVSEIASNNTLPPIRTHRTSLAKIGRLTVWGNEDPNEANNDIMWENYWVIEY